MFLWWLSHSPENKPVRPPASPSLIIIGGWFLLAERSKMGISWLYRWAFFRMFFGYHHIPMSNGWIPYEWILESVESPDDLHLKDILCPSYPHLRWWNPTSAWSLDGLAPNLTISVKRRGRRGWWGDGSPLIYPICEGHENPWKSISRCGMMR